MSEKKEWAAIDISLAIVSGGDIDSISSYKKNQTEISFNAKQKEEKNLRGILSSSDSISHIGKERTRNDSFHVSIALSTDERDLPPKAMKSQSQSGLPDVGSKISPQFSLSLKNPLSFDTGEKPILHRETSKFIQELNKHRELDRGTPREVPNRESPVQNGFSREGSNREGFIREGYTRPNTADLPLIPPSKPVLGKKVKKNNSGTKSEQKFNNLVSFINHSRKNKGDIGDVLSKWTTLSR